MSCSPFNHSFRKHFPSMDHRNDVGDQQEEEILLPGFRFHPTDEELVGFYLWRKVQQKPLCIELIKQLDIYKFDPWDLPKMGNMGEKEWYFYCTRERKYPNSNRPNRVAVAGFWKATGIDKLICSSNNGKTIIGLKKSLVFYKGRAAKAFKTDWKMHEFRLPTANNDVRPNENSWTICRVFKKTTVAQRNLQHSTSTHIRSGNSIGINCVRQELPANEAENQTSSSTDLDNNCLANDQCCSNRTHPPRMTGHSRINENSGDFSEKSVPFQSLEMCQDYFSRDQTSHFDGDCTQVRMSPHIIDFTGYTSPRLDDNLHQQNFNSYEHDEQSSISRSYANHANVDFHENLMSKLRQGSSSESCSFSLNYLMS